MKFRPKRTENVVGLANMFDRLLTKEAHLLLWPAIQTPTRIALYQYLPLHLQSTFCWLVPQAELVPYWKALYLSFSPVIWVLIFASFTFASLVWYFVENVSFLSSLHFFYQLLLEVSSPNMNKIRGVLARVLIFSTLTTFLVISSVFKSEMVRIFLDPPKERQIDSLQGIMEAQLPCVVTESSKSYFEDEKYVSERCTGVPKPTSTVNVLDIFLKIISQKDTALAITYFDYELISYKLFQKRDASPSKHLASKDVIHTYVYFFFVKGYPLYFRIREICDRLIEAGIVQYLWKMFFEEIDFLRKQQQPRRSNTLNSAHISVAFYILFIGLSVSTLVFITECIYSYCLS